MSGRELVSSDCYKAKALLRTSSFLLPLSGETKSGNVLILLAVLVVLLHAWGIMYLLQKVEPEVVPIQPVVMEVSMIAVPVARPGKSDVRPVPPVPEKKPEPKKNPAKVVPNKDTPKTKPVVSTQTPPEVAHKEQASPDPAPVIEKTEAVVSEQAAVAADTKANGNPTVSSAPETESKCQYAYNPEPEYPAIAKSRGWQGKVKLRVRVSAGGAISNIEIEQTSGHEILDEAAIETVKKYQFIPAKQGDTAVACAVIVPITFRISH